MHSGINQIEVDLRRFYDQDFDDNGSLDVAPSIEDERAVDAAERSIMLKNGRFCFGLPLRDDKLKYCCNKFAAQHWLYVLSERFSRDTVLKVKYTKAIERLVQKGYAAKIVTDSEVD